MTIPPSPSQPWSLAGKCAIVTGASRGIGQAIAIHLARKGLTSLAITYVSNLQSALETLEECRKLGVKNTVAIQADALDPSFGTKVIHEALDKIGTKTIDILVNNAVLSDSSKFQPVEQTTLPLFLEIMQGNVFAPISLTTALLPHLPAHGGRVISISSTLAYQPNTDPLMTYGASKATLQSYMRSMADGYSKTTGATFNSVVVGLTATKTVETGDFLTSSGHEEQLRNTTAANRIGAPEDIAYIVGFLAGEESRWVNGAAVSANGGNKLVMAALG